MKKTSLSLSLTSAFGELVKVPSVFLSEPKPQRYTLQTYGECRGFNAETGDWEPCEEPPEIRRVQHHRFKMVAQLLSLEGAKP